MLKKCKLRGFMKLIFIMLTIFASAFSLASELPEWIVTQPPGHSAYCVPTKKNGVDTARVVAANFAIEDLGVGVEQSELNGKEASKSKMINTTVQNEYEMHVDVTQRGTNADYVIVKEIMIKDDLCVLVKAL